MLCHLSFFFFYLFYLKSLETWSKALHTGMVRLTSLCSHGFSSHFAERGRCTCCPVDPRTMLIPSRWDSPPTPWAAAELLCYWELMAGYGFVSMVLLGDTTQCIFLFWGQHLFPHCFPSHLLSWLGKTDNDAASFLSPETVGTRVQ